MDVRWFGDKLLDLFFPRVRCMVCESAEAVSGGVCAACRDGMERYPQEGVCKICGKPCGGRDFCAECRESRPSYDGLRAAFIYHGAVRTLVHAMKYRGEFDLPVRLFAAEMKEVLEQQDWRPECIVPVPSTARTQRRRGYNQAEKLARRVGSLTDIRVERFALKKKRGTRSQVGLNAQARMENLRGTLLPGRGSRNIAKKRVLLVDDICTTGATAEESARVLKACGAEAVYVLCAARVAEDALRRYLAGEKIEE